MTTENLTVTRAGDTLAITNTAHSTDLPTIVIALGPTLTVEINPSRDLPARLATEDYTHDRQRIDTLLDTDTITHIDTTGDGAPDGSFVATTPPIATPTDPADWANVVALRVHLLARNNEPSPGYVDPKTYAMGNNSAGTAQTVTPTTDSYGNNVRPYKRRLFSQLIRAINPSSRRDR